MTSDHNKIVAYWLFFCCFMIAVMVLVGGLTRLTESGLSIVEWKPVSGAIPPLTEQSWKEEFTKYQQTPEYIKKNHGMELSDFKKIFVWEYAHRLVGRSIGFVFFIPFIYFLVTKKLQKRYFLPFMGIFLLGGLQGAIGWYMVKSGLVDRPDVSQYRLALHLGTAFLLYTLIFWTGLTLLKTGKEPAPYQPKVPVWFKNIAFFLPVMVMLQVVLGAFVAGLDAGLVYNTFPTMNGSFVPNGLLVMEPWYINFFENVTAVQFSHRIWAMVTTAAIIGLWCAMNKSQAVNTSLQLKEKNLVHAMLIMVVVQFLLGVLTLLHAVPISLASMHQMGALVLFTLSLAVSHTLKYKVKTQGR